MRGKTIASQSTAPTVRWTDQRELEAETLGASRAWLRQAFGGERVTASHRVEHRSATVRLGEP